MDSRANKYTNELMGWKTLRSVAKNPPDGGLIQKINAKPITSRIR